MKEPILPRQWHLYIVDLNPRIGTKPGKHRPCLAIQPNPFNEAGLLSTMLVPLTTRIISDVDETFPLRVRIPKGCCGLEKASDLLIDQMLAWDNELFKQELGKIPEDLQEKVKEAIREFLDLD